MLKYFFIAALSLVTTISAQDTTSMAAQAERYFAEAKTLSVADNGKLWGMPLYGPIIFVDPATRFFIASQQDNENSFSGIGKVFCGHLPKELNIANTAFDWKGKRWTMVIWPLPGDALERDCLLMHELFHRIQDAVHLPAKNSACNHLDAKEGRILLRLEWAELAKALAADKQAAPEHIKAACILNKCRALVYSGSDTTENQLLMNEGLAEYTGLRLSGATSEQINEMLRHKVGQADNYPSFVRSFAYISGPLYGFLLERAEPEWNKDIHPDASLPDLLASAYSLHLDGNIVQEAETYIRDKADANIIAFENDRDNKRREQENRLHEKFLNGPVLSLPLHHPNVQFDPRNLVPLDSSGTVYPTLRVTDDWGILEVNNEALIAADWGQVVIALPENFSIQQAQGTITTKDWTLVLKTAWEMRQANKAGNYHVSKIDTK